MNTVAIRSYISRHDRDYPDAQAVFFDEFEQSCASSTRVGLACVMEGLHSSSRVLTLNTATRLSLIMTDEATADESKRLRVKCHWLDDDHHGWQVGLSEGLVGFQLSIKVKDAELVDMKIGHFDVYGTPVIDTRELQSAQADIPLVLEHDHIVRTVTATLVKMSSAMTFDTCHKAPSLLAEAVLRTNQLLTPSLRMHRVTLGILGNSHFAAGDVSVSWSDLDTSIEVVPTTPSNTRSPVSATTNARISPKQLIPTAKHTDKEPLLVASNSDPRKIVVELRNQ